MTSRYHQNLRFHYEASTSSKPRHFKLMFSTQVASPVFTTQIITGKASGESGDDGKKSAIKVTLVDSNTKRKITTGPLASAKVKIVLIRGDYRPDSTTKDDEKYFEKHIVDNWDKKNNVLLGDLYVHLESGSGTVGEIRIKQDKNHLKNVKFRLGAMVVDPRTTCCVVEEGVTDRFEVKDKHILPKRLRQLLLEDKVGQLMNISCKRTSKIAMRLKSENVETVKQFLHMHSSNPQKLQKICGIKGKRWEETVNHAKTGNMRIKSASQHESNTLAPPSDGSVEFDNSCYKAQPFDDKHPSISMMIIDPSFSTKDLDQKWEACTFNHVFEPAGQFEYMASVGNSVEGNGGYKARKRWMKVLCIFSLSIVTFTKRVGLGVGVGLTLVG